LAVRRPHKVHSVARLDKAASVARRRNRAASVVRRRNKAATALRRVRVLVPVLVRASIRISKTNNNNQVR
jgi:hypothetical protein